MKRMRGWHRFLFGLPLIVLLTHLFSGTKALNRTHGSNRRSALEDGVAFVTVFTIYNPLSILQMIKQ
ncbi:hypothetical protein S83_029103 [Arachis hypogaea]